MINEIVRFVICASIVGASISAPADTMLQLTESWVIGGIAGALAGNCLAHIIK